MRARQAGAEVVSDPDFGHPFVDAHTRRRFEMIRAFLEQQRDNDQPPRRFMLRLATLPRTFIVHRTP